MCSVRPLGRLHVLLCLCAGSAAAAADRYDPKLRFRTTHTPHFDIHAHQREEALARRLAGIVERRPPPGQSVRCATRSRGPGLLASADRAFTDGAIPVL